MLNTIVLFEGLWDSLVYAPLVIASLGGLLVGVGLFSSRGWQPTCRRCQHDLRGVADSTCPECGANLASRRAVRAGRRQMLIGRTLLGVVLIAVATLPHFGFTPTQLRSALAFRLSHRELSRAALAGGPFFQQIHSQRLLAGDQEYCAAVIEESIAQLETGPLGNAQNQMLRDLDRIASGKPIDAATQKRIAAALVKRSESSAAEARQAAQTLAFLDYLTDPSARAVLQASESLISGFMEAHMQPRIKRGQAISAVTSWGGELTLNLDLEPTITAMRWRPEGTEAWSPIKLEQNDRWTHGGSIDHSGPVEVEVTTQVTLPRDPSLGRDEPRTISSVSTHRTTIVSPESLQLTPVRGAEIRARFQPLLAGMQLKHFGPVIQPKFAMPSARRMAANETPVQFGGRFLIRYDGHEGSVGEYYYAPSGGGGGGGSSTGLEGITFEAGKPIILRIEPSEKALRARVNDDTQYLDEIVELEFDGFDQPPREIRWIEPTSDSAKP